jgi:hypothetical protein
MRFSGLLHLTKGKAPFILQELNNLFLTIRKKLFYFAVHF